MILKSTKHLHEDLSEAYNSSKFLIAPSKYSDGSDWSFGKYTKLF